VPTRREKGRNGRWAAEALEHRQAWGESGLTRLAYAEKAGLAASTFSRWLRNLKRREGEGAADSGAEERLAARSLKAPKTVATEAVKPCGARLVAVQVAASAVEDDGVHGTETSKAASPVEIALPSGIRIRYPAGVGYDELSKLVGVLEREC
jgi:hypothetical protein